MTSITKTQFGAIIRKINKEISSKKSSFASSRISGWGRSSAGADYEYPRFDWSYYRNNQKVTDYSKSEFEEMTVSYYTGETSYDRARQEVLKAKFDEAFVKALPAGTWRTRTDRSGTEVFEVKVTNPFYGRSND